jgi:hypothetical protein
MNMIQGRAFVQCESDRHVAPRIAGYRENPGPASARALRESIGSVMESSAQAERGRHEAV